MKFLQKIDRLLVGHVEESASPGMDSTAIPHSQPSRGGLNILHLPEELSEAILRYVKDTSSPTEFWNCLKTCQDWHRIGLGLHGRLDLSVSTIVESPFRRHALDEEHHDTTISQFTDFSLGGPSLFYLSELRSLTVHVLHARNAGPFVPNAHRNMFDSIVDTFSITRRLTTFSLKFVDDGWDFPHNDVPAIPGSQLAILVASLPGTVVNLEIDTAGVDIPPDQNMLASNESTHMCYQTSTIIARLHHLRLRVGHVCEALLASGPATRSCPCEFDCECCSGMSKALCTRLRAWKLRSLNIWLPEMGHSQSYATRRSLGSLSEISPAHGPATTIVSSSTPASLCLPPGPTYGSFYPSSVWEVESNCPITATDECQMVRIHTMDKYRSTLGPTSNLQYCGEHELLTASLRRLFQVGGDVCPKSPYPYIAEWMLEGSNRWAQEGYRGPRYPATEGDEENKPFWRASHSWCAPRPRGAGDLKDGAGLWACLFPGCRTRCESVHHLRGHQLYAHPTQPHMETYQGARPCPSVGCDRVGAKAFTEIKELEEHLLSHHIYPCTRRPEPVERC